MQPGEGARFALVCRETKVGTVVAIVTDSSAIVAAGFEGVAVEGGGTAGSLGTPVIGVGGGGRRRGRAAEVDDGAGSSEVFVVGAAVGTLEKSVQ